MNPDLFRTVFESSLDAIIVFDKSGIVDCNPSALRMFGCPTRDELIGKHPFDFSPSTQPGGEDSASLANERIAAAFNEGANLFEWTHRRLEGATFPAEVLLTAVELDGKAVLHAMVRDITKRKLRGEEWRTMESGLKDAMRLARVGSWSWDTVTDTHIWSEGIYLIYGRDPGLPPADFQEVRKYFTPESWEKLSAAVEEGLAQGRAYECDAEVVRPDGARRWITARGMATLDAGGKVVGLHGTVQDITERKRAEQSLYESEKLYRSLFENMLNGFAYCQMIFEQEQPHDFIYLSTNATFEALTGLKNVTGKRVSDVIPGIRQSDPKLFEIYGRVSLSGKPERFEIYIEALQQWFWISVYSPGKGYFVAVFDVITERKRMESELLAQNAELENKVAARTADLERARRDADEANRAKSDFLAAMSHEIRTPMNGVIGMIDVLRQTSLKGQQVEMVNIIHDSALSLLDIIEDILDFSKVEAGRLQIDIVPMGIVDVVERACGTMDRIALKKGTELTMFVDPAVPSEVAGDPGRLRQILINLINNAVKFSSGQGRQGKVSVRASLADGKPGPALVEFRVADNGVGMDEQTQARLFKAFMQADPSTTRGYGGTGLGLVISRQLAHLMGGEISVKSEKGKGSLFIVRIPFALPAETSVASKVWSMIAGLSCIVVGDSGSLSADIAAYLTHAGAPTERAPDLAGVRDWIAGRKSGLHVVVVDAGGGEPPLYELRAIADAHRNQQARFVVISRGSRREPRLEDVDLVSVDGNVLTRLALLKAVSIVAGLTKEADQEKQLGNLRVTITPPSREEARRRGRLILVAEDNETNQKVIRQQLMLLGQTADVVENGRKALASWRSGDYGLLITDLYMPEMDGYELTKAVRAGETGKTRMPIIAYTANALKGEVDRCLEVGMDDYISKPVQLAKLEGMLKKWLPVSLESESVPQSSPVPVDVNVLKALVGDDEAVIRDFLSDFRATMAKTTVELRTACMSGQAETTRALAHKLKSSANSVGALTLGELCAEIEQSGRAGDKDALAAMLQGFEQELARVEKFLKERT